MKVITLEGLMAKPGKIASKYRGCKTVKAYSPTLEEDVMVCEDQLKSARRKRKKKSKKESVECTDFGWVKTKSGKRMCKCKTPGNKRIQPKAKCSRNED